MSKLKSGKVAIIGCGFVGSASAFALMQSGLFTEMVLLAGRIAAGSCAQKHCNFPVDYSGNYKKRF